MSRTFYAGGQAYLIASLKHTNSRSEHITFWGPNYCGYVKSLADGHVGRYSADFIGQDGGCLNDGESCIAVPEEAVKALMSPTPYFVSFKGEAARLYDTPGPVVANTRENWRALIAASMSEHRRVLRPKPEVFKGKSRSFSIEQAARGAA